MTDLAGLRSSIRQFIVKECQPPDAFDDGDRLLDSGLLDSLTLLKLASYIERQAGIEVEHHEVSDENFGSIDNIVTFVERKRPA